MGPTDCPETSASNYHLSPHNNLEERSSLKDEIVFPLSHKIIRGNGGGAPLIPQLGSTYRSSVTSPPVISISRGP